MLGNQFSQPRMSSQQAHFSNVPRADIPRSVFNRSSGLKTTFDAGRIIPIYCDEVLPGDSIKLRMTSFARLATPIVPFMDNLYADTFFFFVPNRLVWDNWEKFNGAQKNPGDSTDFLIPQCVSPAVSGYLGSELHDYFGLPTQVPLMSHNNLPLRAYNLIYNDWFRDQDINNSLVVDTGDGPDNYVNYQLPQYRIKRPDYFTSARPWPQKGPSINIPLAATAPIIPDATDPSPTFRTIDGSSIRTLYGVSGTTTVQANANWDTTNHLRWIDPSLTADLSAVGGTINELREAYQIQKMFERDARGGTRYIEILRAHFGVISPDARLQRPEFLGGGSTMINTSPIPQTSSTDATTPQGNLSAVGTFSHHGVGFTKSFVEHGYIIGLISVRADYTYQNRLDKMWSRQTRFDFYWPAFAHLGEQAILNKELVAVGTSADNDVFGYQERFAEYRYKPSQITGQFKSSAVNTLDYWHLAQQFVASPGLSPAFIVENPPVDRVIAVPSEPHFLFDAVFSSSWARPMPTYSVPGLVDHF